MNTADRYTVITADSHAGGSHEQYREYLDPRFHEEFDAWRGQYKNPWKDLRDTDLRIRNWDSNLRWEQQQRDGVVAEVVYPNTVPPFYPGFVLFAQPPRPEEYERRHAGVQAHNRWLVDFVNECPERRAGIGQIFLNDIDDAIEDVKWIRDNGLRGGVLLPNIAPDVKWVKPLYDPEYDRLWAVLQDLDIPINLHGGTGLPDYGRYEFSMLLYINEVQFYAQRPFVHMLLGGVFERFPKLRVAITESGCRWVPDLLRNLDGIIRQIRDTGQTGEIKYTDAHKRTLLASEAFEQNVWLGVSQPGPSDVAVLPEVGVDKFMWGNDYPHDEGTYPYTRETLRQLFTQTPEADMRKILGENAAKFYGFDLTALTPLASQHGPTIAELREPLVELPENPNDALLRGAGLHPLGV